MLTAFEKELFDAKIGKIIYGLYLNGVEDINIDIIFKHLESDEYHSIDDELKSLAPSIMDKWICYFEERRKNYIQKSNAVNWLNDSSYDVWPKDS